MAKSAIRADIHEPLDVHRYFFAEVTFDAALRVDHLRDLADLFLAKLFDSNPTTDPHLIQDGSGTVVPDAEYVGESDIDALFAR